MTFGPTTDINENYDSPVLRRLTQTWEAYDYEEIEEEDVLHVLNRVENLTRTQLASMQESARYPEVDVLEPNRIAIFQAFEDHIRAVDKMRRFFREGDPELVDEGLDIIQQATNRMMRGLEGILTEDDLPPKLCLSCHSPNLRGARSCSKCHAALPFIERPLEKRLIAVAGPETEIEL